MVGVFFLTGRVDVLPEGFQAVRVFLLFGMCVAYGGWQLRTDANSRVHRAPLRLSGSPTPLPGFGLRHVRFRWRRFAFWLAVSTLVPVAIAASFGGREAALVMGLVVLLYHAASNVALYRNRARDVHVIGSTSVGQSWTRTETIPLAALRRIESEPCATVVLVFAGHPRLRMVVIAGFAQFLEAMTTAAPWVEVTERVVAYGSHAGTTNGFYVVPDAVAV